MHQFSNNNVKRIIIGMTWNFHYETVHSMMKSLTMEDEFTDMTVVRGNEALDYQVHKVVLSAVSPVFKEILINNPHKHPLIYHQCERTGLQCLLKLIYFGHLTIDDSRVEKFIRILQEV